MSGKQNGLRRNMGVRNGRDLDAEKRIAYSRPEGSDQEIGRTQAHKAGDTGHTMAPKRWQERKDERHG